MAYALGSLDPSVCTHLEEAEPLLEQIADLKILSQILIEHELLTEDDWKYMNTVSGVLIFLVIISHHIILTFYQFLCSAIISTKKHPSPVETHQIPLFRPIIYRSLSESEDKRLSSRG